jgi:hypothetical protein
LKTNFIVYILSRKRQILAKILATFFAKLFALRSMKLVPGLCSVNFLVPNPTHGV